MENFEENNNLLDFHGTINRRNFIVNILLVETLRQALIITPLLIVTLLDTDLLKRAYTEAVMPEWWYVIAACSALICAFLYMPSVIKRVRDIFGEERKDKVFSYSLCTFIIMLVGVIASVSTNVVFLFVKCFGIGIILSLMMMKGSISGAKPKSEIARFNWGAFLTTWLWGLFNRSYKTLWAIPLFFTTGFFPFALICGIRGNEWAYEKSQEISPELFHLKQRKQTIIWCILTPVIAVITGSLIFISSAVMLKNYSNAHPDFLQKTEEFYTQAQAQMAQNKFDRIEFTKNEYKFYLEPKIWSKTSANEKFAFFDMASSYVLSKISPKDMTDEREIIDVWSKTKIYSSFNDEKLMEFKIPPEKTLELVKTLKKNPDAQHLILKEIPDGYKINSYPSLP